MNTPDTEWEKEFDVIFPQFLEYPDSFTTQFETDPANRRKIKDFITKTISSRDTYWKERVRKEVEVMRKEYTPADMIWIGDEEQEVGEWKLVPKEGGLYCLSCGRFTPEEGCLCGWVSIDTLLDNLK